MTTTPNQNVAIVERFVAAENEHDIDQIAQLVHPRVAFYGNGRLVADSWEGYRPVMAATFAAFPDSRRELLMVAAEDDRVAFRWRVEGTHSAPYGGAPASGNHVTFNGTSWIKVAEGKIVEAWFDMDLAGPLRQMTEK